MKLTVELPADFITYPVPGRRALELLAIEGHRSEALTHFEASSLLGLGRFEFENFLKDRGVFEHAYGVGELEEGLRNIALYRSRSAQRNIPKTTVLLTPSSDLR